jgi:hypothetical protein
MVSIDRTLRALNRNRHLGARCRGNRIHGGSIMFSYVLGKRRSDRICPTVQGGRSDPGRNGYQALFPTGQPCCDEQIVTMRLGQGATVFRGHSGSVKLSLEICPSAGPGFVLSENKEELAEEMVWVRMAALMGIEYGPRDPIRQLAQVEPASQPHRQEHAGLLTVHCCRSHSRSICRDSWGPGKSKLG